MLLSWHIQRLFNAKPEFLGDGNYAEIGIFDGELLAFVASRFPNKMCYGIDPFVEDGNTSWITNVEAGNKITVQEENSKNAISCLLNTHVYKMFSQNFNKHLTPELVEALNITCVFVDGDHRYDAVLNDCELALKLIGKKSGTIIFDDWQIDSVKSAVYSFFTNHQEKDRFQDVPISADIGDPPVSTALALMIIIKASP